VKKHGIEVEGRSLPETFKDFKNTEVTAKIGVRTFETASGDEGQENTAGGFKAA
jgi:hypothetical protein